MHTTGAPLTPHRRWALDVLIEAVKDDTFAVAEVREISSGKHLHMIGKIDGEKFTPVAVLMDSQLIKQYSPELSPIIVP